MTKQISESLEKIQKGLGEYTDAIIAALEKPSAPPMQAGVARLSNSDSNHDSSVAFPIASFSSPPVVVATGFEANTGTKVQIHIVDVTARGFRVAHGPMPHRQVSLHWMAMPATPGSAGAARASAKGKASAAKKPATKSNKR